MDHPPGLAAAAPATFGPRRARVVLAGILLVALAVRLWNFVGLASGDPQDDGIYYGNALTLAREGPVYLDRLRLRPSDGLYNPVAQFDVRPLVTFPIAAAFVLFGPGELAAVAWPLACSLATVLLAYLLGRDVADRPTGLLAALVSATSPLDVVTGTRILSDAPLGATTALAVWLLCTSVSRARPVAWWVAAGAAAGAGCLANGRGFVIAAAVIGVSVLLAWRRRSPHGGGVWPTRVLPAAPLWCAAGLAVVLAAEAGAYAATTGDPWQNLRIHAGAARFKYRYETVETVALGPVRVHVTNGTPFQLTATALGNAATMLPLGWVFPAALASLTWCLARRQHMPLVVFAVALFAYFEFGAVAVGVDVEARRLDYFLVFKQTRFLVALSAVVAVLIGAAGRALALRRPWVAVAAGVALVVTSLSAAAQGRDHYRSGVADLRAAMTFVAAYPERLIFTDPWAASHLQVFSRHRLTAVRNFTPAATEADLRGGCVLVGGSRGVELLAAYVESTLPPSVRAFVDAESTPPPGWEVAFHVPGPRWAMRFRDLRIYCPVTRVEW